MKNNYSVNEPSNEPSMELLDCLTAVANLISNGQPAPQDFKAPKISADTTSVLLALSGGSDSTALLVALSKIAPAFGLQIIACHVNHNLRSDESEKDAQFCQQICEQLNVECQTVKLSLVKSKHASEDTLRQLRYEQLVKVALAKNIRFLLTAHTLDDQIETVLFRLFRGTSPSGLKGIENCRKLENNLYLFRPLLKLSKLECQNFLASQGLAFREDSSNLNEIYSRNYIRHKILPVIIKRFPALSTHLDSLIEISKTEDAYLDQIAFRLFEHFQSVNPDAWSIDIFKQQPLALQRRILTYALKNRSIEVSFKRVGDLISLAIANFPSNSQSFSLNLNKEWRIKRTKNKILWQRFNKTLNNCRFEPLLITIPGVNRLSELNSELLVEAYQEKANLISSTNPLQVSSDGRAILVDLSRINPPLILRQRQSGDKIHPLGMSQMVKLKKYLHTHKSVNVQPFYPQLLLADQEEVLWLPGIGMSEKIKVIDIPSHILQWRQCLSAKP